MFDPATIECPYCGKSYYIVGRTARTAMYYPPIYKDGVNINPDRNVEITICDCLNCGKSFRVIDGEVEKVEDESQVEHVTLDYATGEVSYE